MKYLSRDHKIICLLLCKQINNVVKIESLGKSMFLFCFILQYSCCDLQTRCTVCIFWLCLCICQSSIQLICQAQQALATFKSFVLSLLLRLMRARDSNLSSICYFVSKFCIASVCICAITPTEFMKSRFANKVLVGDQMTS